MLTSFLFLNENIYCGYSLEVPRWGTTNEYPQHMFSLRNKKNITWIHPLICSYVKHFKLTPWASGSALWPGGLGGNFSLEKSNMFNIYYMIIIYNSFLYTSTGQLKYIYKHICREFRGVVLEEYLIKVLRNSKHRDYSFGDLDSSLFNKIKRNYTEELLLFSQNGFEMHVFKIHSENPVGDNSGIFFFLISP